MEISIGSSMILDMIFRSWLLIVMLIIDFKVMNSMKF